MNQNARKADELIGYQAAHIRIRKELGPASAWACVDCGRSAHEWSYNHCDPKESRRVVPSGEVYGRYQYEVPYSVNPSFHEPRCRSCHRKFDKAVRTWLTLTGLG